jgi:hypothetical protein
VLPGGAGAVMEAMGLPVVAGPEGMLGEEGSVGPQEARKKAKNKAQSAASVLCSIDFGIITPLVEASGSISDKYIR